MTSGPEAAARARAAWRQLARNPAAVIIAAGLALVAATLVMLSFQRPEPPTFPPSSLEPAPAGDELVGPRTYTVDSRDPVRWQFFSFSRGSLVAEPGPTEWDLAFRRFQVIVNGGNGFPGKGGVIQLGEVSFDSIDLLPEGGYQGTEPVPGDSISAAFEDWYAYSFVTHLLSPRPIVYGIRAADGRYGKLRFLSYYCSGALPGCVTFEYVFLGGGGREIPSPG